MTVRTGHTPATDPLAITHARATATLENPARSCQHIGAPDTAALHICLQHVDDAGVLCQNCMQDHIAGHNPADESTCDGCKRTVNADEALLPLTAIGEATHQGTLATMPIFWTGLGFCETCFDGGGAK